MAKLMRFGGLLAGFVAGVVWMIACGGDSGGGVTPVDAQTPTGPQTVITADSDISRMESGNIPSNATTFFREVDLMTSGFSSPRCTLVTEGPFVLTDFVHSPGDEELFLVAATGEQAPARWILVKKTGVNGARYAVRAGEKLYACWSSVIQGRTGDRSWSGFRPY